MGYATSPSSGTTDHTYYWTATQSVAPTYPKVVDIAAALEPSSALSPAGDYSYDLIDKTEITATQTKKIGGGGFGEVFIGEHRTVGLVALKLLRVANDQEHMNQQLRRSLREARIWQELKHPNVLPFLGILDADNALYLVSPYVKNGSVSEYLRQNPNADRQRLLWETAAALVYLYEHNIIHGDIKASNILVSDDVHAVLCDFGLARPTSETTSVGLKGAGTLRWQSPERAEPNSRKTFESDVFAFGMTIYEVLSGRVPFYDQNSFGVVRAILNNQRPPTIPTHSPQGISYAPVWGVAVDCWEKDPNCRPTIQEAHQRLESSSMPPAALESSEGQSSPTYIKDPVPPASSCKPFRSPDQPFREQSQGPPSRSWTPSPSTPSFGSSHVRPFPRRRSSDSLSNPTSAEDESGWSGGISQVLEFDALRIPEPGEFSEEPLVTIMASGENTEFDTGRPGSLEVLGSRSDVFITAQEQWSVPSGEEADVRKVVEPMGSSGRDHTRIDIPQKPTIHPVGTAAVCSPPPSKQKRSSLRDAAASRRCSDPPANPNSLGRLPSAQLDLDARTRASKAPTAEAKTKRRNSEVVPGASNPTTSQLIAPARILANDSGSSSSFMTPRTTPRLKQTSLPEIVPASPVATQLVGSGDSPDASYVYKGPLLRPHSRPAPSPYEPLPEGSLGPLQPEDISQLALSHMTDGVEKSDSSPSARPKVPFIPGLYRAVKAFHAKDEGERSLLKGDQTWCDMPGGGPGQGWVIASEIVGREVRYALVPEAFLELVYAF